MHGIVQERVVLKLIELKKKGHSVPPESAATTNNAVGRVGLKALKKVFELRFRNIILYQA